MANEKIDMDAFVRDIREKQGLDEDEGVGTVVQTSIGKEISANSNPINSYSESKKQLGRPKKVRKIVDGAPMSMMFSNDLKKKMAMVKFNQKIEMKDLIAGATVIFLDRYYRDGSLTEEGQMILEEALVKFYGE